MNRHRPGCCDSRCEGCRTVYRKIYVAPRPSTFARGIGQGAGMAVGCLIVGAGFVALGILFVMMAAVR